MELADKQLARLNELVREISSSNAFYAPKLREAGGEIPLVYSPYRHFLLA